MSVAGGMLGGSCGHYHGGMEKIDGQNGTSQTAVWYFVVATFLFVGGVFALTMAEGLMAVAAIAIGLGAVIAIVGAFVFKQENGRSK